MLDAASLAKIVAAVLVFLACSLYAGDAYVNSSLDPKEPPIVQSSFPLLGHAYGFFMRGNSYYGLLKVDPSKLMYTIRMLPVKVYIVNTTELIGAVQRAAKTVSFRPFEKMTVERFSHVEQKIVDLCDEGGDFEGDGTFVRKIDAVIYKSLLPGPDLDKMNMDTAVELSRLLDNIEHEKSNMLDMYDWVQKTMTLASTRGAYGPQNPYGSAEGADVIQTFWNFEKDSAAILVGMHRLVPKAYEASKMMIPHFVKYFNNRGYEQASALINGRAQAFRSYGLSDDTCARLEWPLGLGILSNTVPTSFWLLYDIFSRPALLAEIRDNLRKAVTSSMDHEQSHHTLDLAKVKTDCKILLATFQEMQRIRNRHASVRKVVADTVLEQKYLLKKDSYLQFPTQPVHYDTSLWGPDAAAFNPHRFIDRAEKPKSTSLLAWGFAPHMCPARQFATAEILILAALVVLRFDVIPEGGHGWPTLGLDTSRISTLPPPKKDVRVQFEVREEWKGVWNVNVGQSSSKFALVSG